MVEPKHSASTDRSIRLTAAPEGMRPATFFMPWACSVLSEIRSRTEMPMSWMQGKERIGVGCGAGLAMRSATHFFMLRFIVDSSFLMRCGMRRSVDGKAALGLTDSMDFIIPWTHREVLSFYRHFVFFHASAAVQTKAQPNVCESIHEGRRAQTSCAAALRVKRRGITAGIFRECAPWP